MNDIQRTVTVQVPVDRAFKVFTERFNTWWPPAYHIGPVDMAEAILEPKEGGRWYERGVDGSECEWGVVLAWDPPTRLVVTWQINGEWQYDPDPAHASEIEVRFTADGPQQTVVELEHRYLERLDHYQELLGAIGGDGGWLKILTRFGDATKSDAIQTASGRRRRPGESRARRRTGRPPSSARYRIHRRPPRRRRGRAAP